MQVLRRLGGLSPPPPKASRKLRLCTAANKYLNDSHVIKY